MTDRRRGKRQSGSWAWLPLGALTYAAVALALLTLGLDPIRDTGLAPAWAGLVAPVLVYLAFAFVSMGRLSMARVLAAFLGLGALHALVVASTGLLLVSLNEPVSRLRGIEMAVRGYPTLTLAQLIVVPLMLAPLRRLLIPHPRYARPARPVPSPRAVPPSRAPAPVAYAPSIPPPSPASAKPPREPIRIEVPPVNATTPGAADAIADIAMPAAYAEPAQRPAREPMEEVVRIPFARISDQLPAETFRLPLDRVAANLLEPGYVLVPRHLLTPQLAEGAAQVKWDVVAEQFPRQALALTDADLARRLPNGALVLPLDEILAQVPPELFTLSSPAVDVRGIEDFPPPFQPHVPPPSPPAADTTAQSAEPVEAPLVKAPEPPLASEPDPEPAAVEDWARPIEPAPAPASAMVIAAPVPTELTRVAGLLAPSLSTLTVDVVTVAGTRLVVAAAPSFERAAVVDTATRTLPFLTDARLAAPPEQLTVRAEEAVLVLTPLGADTTLAVVPASGASLALLERLALRAAAEMGQDGAREPTAATASDDELRDVTVPAHVRALADSLGAFGPVTPTVLRDVGGAVVLYLFLPSHVDPRPLGAFARDLARGLEGAPLGRVSAVTVRLGAHRVVIRTAEATVARTTLLVTGGGPVARPGLARLELERAVLRLGAL